MKILNTSLLLMISSLAYSNEYKFDNSLIWGGGGNEITYSNSVKEGIRPANFSINNKKEIVLDKVFFKKNKVSNKIEPCFTKEQISLLGIKLKSEVHNNICQFLSDIDNNIKMNNVNAEGKINIKIPQYLIGKVVNDISPEQWGNGSSSLSMNYNSSYYQSKYKKNSNNSIAYNSQWKGTISNGFILKADLNAIKNTKGDMNAKNNYYYLQKDLKSQRSRIVVGKNFSNGYFFEPYKFTGVNYFNSKEMWPDSELMFRPSITGIATQLSIVEIYQNNILIKKEEVQPGRYEINDYSPLYYGGDFEVKVLTPSGNEITKYTVTYSTGGLFINKNNYLYTLSVGRIDRYNGSFISDADNIYEVDFIYGLNDVANLKYGYLYSTAYSSLLNGVAWSTSIGFINFDLWMSGSHPIFDGMAYSGYSLKTTYQKNINRYNISNIVLSNNLFNSKNFRTLSQTYSKDNEKGIKQDYSIQINGDFFNDSINVGGGLRRYWGKDRKEEYVYIGYTGAHRSINYNISFFNSKHDISTLFNIQIPFGSKFENSILTNYIHNKNGPTSTSFIYNRTLSEKNANINLGVTEYDNKHKVISGSGGVNSDYLDLYQSLNRDDLGSVSNSTNISGSVIYIDDGFVFSRRLSDTSAIVKVNGISNGKVSNTNSSIDARGYSQISLSPYKENMVSISLENTPINLDTENKNKKIIPVKDSISLVKVDSQINNSIFIKFENSQIEKVRFSDPIYDDAGNIIGNFTQGNYVLIKRYNGENPIHYFNSDKKCISEIKNLDEKLLGLNVYKATKCELFSNKH